MGCYRVLTAKDQIPLRYPACDQLASRSQTSSRAGRTRAGRRPASWIA